MGLGPIVFPVASLKNSSNFGKMLVVVLVLG